MGWRGYWRFAVGLAGGLGTLLYLSVLLVDPYGTVWFSPPLARAPVDSNQRFSYPAIARDPGYDSVVIGTSTTRMLHPDLLEEAFGGNFANLSLNSGTAYEQRMLMDLFAEHHADIETVVVGIDTIWCQRQDDYARFTPRPFPPWMYDEDRWNDLLHLFDLRALEQTGKQIGWLLGIRDSAFDRDGFRAFLPGPSEYDLERARGHIYGAGPRRPHDPVEPAAQVPEAERRAWVYATHDDLAAMLGALPAATVKILMLVPYHHRAQPPPGSQAELEWRECRRRLVAIAEGFDNAHVVDFMFHSDIAMRDENYWDMLHYGASVADRLPGWLAEAVRDRADRPGIFRYLGPGGTR
ncbi:MAG: hypothetical protein HOH66_08265 [Rhodospirillaceae bacterium]|jgi:hypothetical protein|nr:hypothetical protein [Rhodospirillaceae bacterium]